MLPDSKIVASVMADPGLKAALRPGLLVVDMGSSEPVKTRALAAELDAVADRLRRDPRAFIAQETIQLSTHPTWTDTGLRARHIDLRPFVLQGRTVEVLPGGLTRVALREGSLIVNSSQGGGSKDTWVLA